MALVGLVNCYGVPLTTTSCCSQQLESRKEGHASSSHSELHFSNQTAKRAGFWKLPYQVFKQPSAFSSRSGYSRLLRGGRHFSQSSNPHLFSGVRQRHRLSCSEKNELSSASDLDGSVLTGDGSELQNTQRLVECAMLAATAGLAFFLSNLFRLEAYLGCFFPLPVVISSMRWGVEAGRKTMLATAMLLLVLSGPLKAASYLLMHGFVGLAIGSLWKWRANWLLSIAVCTSVRCVGAIGFVLMSSWLLKENLLGLITVNAHASFSYILAALGINIIPSMLAIYFVFAGLLFINCGSFVFLLHVLYAIFMKRLGIPMAIAVPGWIERAI